MKFIARKPVVRTEVYRKYGFTYVEHKPCYCPRCKDKTAHDAICSASKPQTQVFRSDWTRRDNEADMFVKMVKRLAKGFNFKLCDRIRFEDPETGKKYL